MSVLTQAPFSLIQGVKVVSRISAVNSIGQSNFSAPSSSYNTSALIQNVPSKPSVGPLRGNLTTTN